MSIFASKMEKEAVAKHFVDYLYELNSEDAFRTLAGIGDDGEEGDDCMYTEYMHDHIYRAIRKLGIDLQVLCGATRIVLYEPDFPFVIKFQPFEDTNGDNYCEQERTVYEMACEDGWEDYFCPVEKLCKFTFVAGDRTFTRDIYVMPVCDCDEDAITSKSYKHQARPGSNHHDADGDAALLELAAYLRGHDEGVLNIFMDFLREWGVNDLHCGNWGYLDGKLVITDYAGYGSHECNF